jgi:hypothetical protein
LLTRIVRMATNFANGVLRPARHVVRTSATEFTPITKRVITEIKED